MRKSREYRELAVPVTPLLFSVTQEQKQIGLAPKAVRFTDEARRGEKGTLSCRRVSYAVFFCVMAVSFQLL
jgi:hypothetical protein